MATEYVYGPDGSLDILDLGEAQCKICGYPVMGKFRNGQLVATEPCHECGPITRLHCASCEIALVDAGNHCADCQEGPLCSSCALIHEPRDG